MGRLSSFPLVKTITAFIFFISYAVVTWAANSVTLTGTGGTSVTYTFTPGTPGSINVSGTFSDFNAASVSPDGGTYYDPGAGTSVITGSTTTAWVQITRFGTVIAGPVQLGDTADYYFDFRVVPNNTAHVIYYKVYQGETLITTYNHGAGSGSQEVHVTGLTEPPPLVTVVAETGGWVANSSGIPVWQDSLYKEVVGGGSPTNSTEPPEATQMLSPSNTGADSTGGSTGTPVTPNPTPTPPATPTPTPGPATPTNTPNQSSPTPRGNPYSPSGSAGTTKADLEDAVNKLVQDANETREQNVTNTNKLVAGINNILQQSKTNADSVVSAVNNLNQKNNQGFKAITDGLNNTNSILGISNQHLAVIRENSVTQKNYLTEAETRRVALEEARQNALDSSTTEGLEAAQNTQDVILSASEDSQVTEFGAGGSGSNSVFRLDTRIGVLDFDPLSDPKVGELILWLKAAVAWFIVVTFYWFVWTEFKQYTMNPWGAVVAKANNAPGGIGGPASLLQATLVTATLVGLPVVFFAAVDTHTATWKSAFTDDPVTLAQAGTSAMKGGVYLAVSLFPVSTMLAAILSSFYVRVFGVVTVAGVQTIIRYLGAI